MVAERVPRSCRQGDWAAATLGGRVCWRDLGDEGIARRVWLASPSPRPHAHPAGHRVPATDAILAEIAADTLTQQANRSPKGRACHPSTRAPTALVLHSTALCPLTPPTSLFGFPSLPALLQRRSPAPPPPLRAEGVITLSASERYLGCRAIRNCTPTILHSLVPTSPALPATDVHLFPSLTAPSLAHGEAATPTCAALESIAFARIDISLAHAQVPSSTTIEASQPLHRGLPTTACTIPSPRHR
ncbi:uncharacterized protein BDZ99DRAFT_521917 [Mytilinidion resinicola]|uniref:Uncharacterized protein n=1 Tax=Mytilinidion resinicola TaxID=574789 RepID=A0A6A6YHT4_9PEZI|nr:uncharacterized protein BDZ99DRAFT_521917 [Mytilinidion resinicola]KAF2808361.1 hypothetical protein BDZ99DRAFT_521917 [Mytilinidion resinicola]